MRFADALTRTWLRAAMFAIVFVLIGFILDSVTGRDVDWTTRGVTIIFATGVYWLLSAWMMTRRQG